MHLQLIDAGSARQHLYLTLDHSPVTYNYIYPASVWLETQSYLQEVVLVCILRLILRVGGDLH